MIQSYDIQIAAGGTQILEVGAQIFDFLSSGSAFDVIQVLPEFQQGNVSLKLGQGFDAGKVVNRWFVKNPGTTAINGTVVLSTAGFRNFRISGDVNVLDGGKSRTLTGAAFSASNYSNAVAAQYSRMQLWNPGTNTKRLIVEAVNVFAATASNLAMMSSNVALATLVQYGQPKMLGGAVSMAQLMSDTNAAGPGVGLDSLAVVGGQSQNFVPHEPIIVPPGYGLLVWDNVANNSISGNFEWYEEPNT